MHFGLPAVLKHIVLVLPGGLDPEWRHMRAMLIELLGMWSRQLHSGVLRLRRWVLHEWRAVPRLCEPRSECLALCGSIRFTSTLTRVDDIVLLPLLPAECWWHRHLCDSIDHDVLGSLRFCY